MDNLKLQVTFNQGYLKPINSVEIDKAGQGLKPGKVYDITIHGDKRSLDQNALQHVWYNQIAKAMHQTPKEVRQYCKLHFGIGIMRSDSYFNETYAALIKDRFSYPEKLQLMDWLPVTSLMTKTQETQYLETVQQHFAEQGIILESH